MKRDEISESILRTLIYAEVFGSACTREQLVHLRLGSASAPRAEILAACARLVRAKRIFQKGDWYSLTPNFNPKRLDVKQRASKDKLDYSHEKLKILMLMPTVLGIAATGSVAIGSAGEADDIDLMIVTRAGFLWTTRALIALFLWGHGLLRRRSSRSLANMFCLNLWIDSDSMRLPQRSLYVARELHQVQWLFERHAIGSQLMSQNPWTRKYVSGSRRKPSREVGRSVRIWSRLFIPFELSMYLIQTAYMHKRTREIVTPHKAFFHPRDTGGMALKKYQRLCRRYNIESLI